MKRQLKKCILLSVIIVLAGCAIGNGRICGPQTPTAYCNKEAYQKLVYPKSYLENWEREGGDSIERRRDSIECGAVDNSLQKDPDGYPVFSDEDLEAVRRAGEELIIAEKRLRADWQRCMINRGYTISEKWMLLTDDY